MKELVQKDKRGITASKTKAGAALTVSGAIV
jgi:hypothetical protein